ncbi:universal stress protein [Arthrobacter crusticola]|uniref:Universal stress protein n=1 Tax=Arthrobacter crusticola TaxID=2547960 RepID=A0A4V3AMS8_9MICC|nr:universal stress protein [Arthrobacter crusticola]TDK27944.1 universal stress protein [Arthrobacter crusticola]
MNGSALPVLVGYDGSDEAATAVRWAARYAQRSALPLTVVHCWIWPLFTHNLGPVRGVEGSGLRHAAEAALEEGREVAAEAAPGLVVETRLVTGYPAAVMTTLSRNASMVVSGSRGLGGFLGQLVGSVSLHLAAGAHCPVAVIRQAAAEGAPVVSAVDGSDESLGALVLACHIASQQGAVLEVVHVGQDLPASLLRRRTQPAPQDESILRRAVDLAHATEPELTIKEVPLTSRSVPGSLLKLTGDAFCLVLGAKGVGGLGTRLGSTVHAVLHHSKGNVVIWRNTAAPVADATSDAGEAQR